jgi:hypothetical protein
MTSLSFRIVFTPIPFSVSSIVLSVIGPSSTSLKELSSFPNLVSIQMTNPMKPANKASIKIVSIVIIIA